MAMAVVDLPKELSNYQQYQILKGIHSGVDVTLFNSIEFDGRKMKQIRLGLEAGLDVSSYAHPRFTWWQMWQMRMGLMAGIDMSGVSDPLLIGQGKKELVYH